MSETDESEVASKERSSSGQDLLLRVHDLTLRLEEAREILSAIRTGQVDALIIKIGEEEYVHALESADYIYQILFESLNEGALTLSADGTILSANTRFAHLVGVPLPEVLRAPLDNFVVPGDLPRLAALLEEGVRGRSKGEIALQAANGVPVPVMVSLNATGMEGTSACTAVVADLTERKRAEEALREANDALEEQVKARTAALVEANEALQEADRRKDEFLALLSHELRNPLGAINNAVEAVRLQESDCPPSLRVHDVLRRQVVQMTRLLDDLLEVSHIAQGKIALHKGRVDLAAAVARAVETIRPRLEVRRHTLEVSLPKEPLPLEADSARLEQVLTNLLGNAVKYTEPGGRIWLSAEREENQAVVRVRDTGVGISPELLPRVFDLFMQADCSMERSQGGLGIGLTLVGSLVEMHGGSVEALSPGPGKGSEFIVRLPALPARARVSGLRPVGSEELSGRPRRVLVVDDNVDAAKMLALCLERWGHQVRVAHDGSAAIETAIEYLPEVIFLDLGLPRMDGYEVARRLRQQAGLSGARLVALTGYGHEEARRKSRESGFDQHLVKPVGFVELQKLLAAMPEGL